jgi:hypothetical protein
MPPASRRLPSRSLNSTPGDDQRVTGVTATEGSGSPGGSSILEVGPYPAGDPLPHRLGRWELAVDELVRLASVAGLLHLDAARKRAAYDRPSSPKESQPARTALARGGPSAGLPALAPRKDRLSDRARRCIPSRTYQALGISFVYRRSESVERVKVLVSLGVDLRRVGGGT